MKRNHWLKLKEDFFKQPYIKKLRKIAGGDTYTIIYQKILLMSINAGGYINFQGIEPTLEEELALILDEDIENVKITLQFMKSAKLIEKDKEKDIFLLPEIMTIIGSESESAQRVRVYREKQKTLHCNADVTKCNQNVTLDRDIDIDIDIEEKEKNKEKEKTIPLKNEKPKAKIKNKYGKLSNIFLSEVEFNKIRDAGLEPYIDTLSLYVGSTGRRYKSHYATILTWERNDKNKGVINNGIKPKAGKYDNIGTIEII